MTRSEADRSLTVVAAVAAATAVAATVALLPGCDRARPGLVRVRGTVRLAGRPLEGAEVRLVPDPGNHPLTPGRAVTGLGGRYDLGSPAGRGVAPGRYKALITRAARNSGPGPPEVGKADPAMDAFGLEAVAEATRGRRPVAGGRAAAKGAFDVEVPGGGGVFEFDAEIPSPRPPDPGGARPAR